jgi:hypothetical protein
MHTINTKHDHAYARSRSVYLTNEDTKPDTSIKTMIKNANMVIPPYSLVMLGVDYSTPFFITARIVVSLTMAVRAQHGKVFKSVVLVITIDMVQL